MQTCQKLITSFLFVLFLVLEFINPTRSVAGLKIDGEYRVRGFNYYQPDSSSNYILQQATLNTAVQEGMTTGVVQFYLNNLSSGNQSTGGNILGTSGPYSSNLQTGPLIHQAYLEVAYFTFGRSLIKLGHGIILNDTSDNITVHFPIVGIARLEFAYLKLFEPDSSSYGTPDDYDKNGLLLDLKLKFDETNSFGFFYVSEFQKATGLLIEDTTALAIGATLDIEWIGIDWSGELDNISGHDGYIFNNHRRVGTNLYIMGSKELGGVKAGVEFMRVRGRADNAETSYNSFAGDFIGGHGVLLNNQTHFGGGIDLNQGMAEMGDPSGYWNGLSHNFQSIKGFVSFNLFKKLSVNIEFFPLVTVIDRGVLGLTNEKIGAEGNITGTYPIYGNLKVSAGIAYFKAGDALQEIAGKYSIPTTIGENVIKSHLSLSATF
jgi:hypothetical protein